jgi:hypothetical protein
MWIGNTIIGLILLALAIAGAWRWYEALSKNSEDGNGGTRRSRNG